MLSIRRCLYALLFSLFSLPASATTVIRINTSLGPIDVELFDATAPVTVANFLSYSSIGRFDSSFIHRSVPNFVIQGGGFTFDPNMGTGEFAFGEGLDSVPTFDPIVNEFGASNLRGTIAMAKLGGDPNSATSQWFFNLADNSANLDNQNGGFTVFGQVLGDGMTVVDAIAAVDRFNASSISSALSELPLFNFTPGDPVLEENLILISSVVEVNNIVVDVTSHDFGNVAQFTSAIIDITVENRSNLPLELGTVGSGNSLSSPFSIMSENCSGQILAADETCTITVQFSPASVDTFSDSFSIPSDDLDSPIITVQLDGVGVAGPDPDIQVDNAGPHDFGDVELDESAETVFTITNDGTVDSLLGISSIEISNNNFTITGSTCTDPLSQSSSCAITVNFAPTDLGTVTATLTIASNDPDTPELVINLSGNGVPETFPVISLSTTTLDLGTVIATLVNSVGEEVFTISNTGTADLLITGITISPDTFDTVESTCEGKTIAPGGSCVLTIFFSVSDPDFLGVKTAVMNITSDDPTNPSLDVTLTGLSVIDNDGIDDSIEDAGPNGGDGNNDGILDSAQPEVATFRNFNNDYVTIVTQAGTWLESVSGVATPDLDGGPQAFNSTINFGQGFYKFTVGGVGFGGGVVVTLIMPEGTTADAYFKFGPEPGNTTDHWYIFNPESSSGTGAVISDNIVTLVLIDGRRGDSDGLVDGMIVDPGGPAVVTPLSSVTLSSGGGGGGCTIASTPRRPLQAMDIWLLLAMGALLGLRLALQRRTGHSMDASLND